MSVVSMRGLAFASLLMAFGFAVGCTPRPDRHAVKQYAEQLRPEVGQESIETYVKRWGTPSQRIEVPDGMIYCWRISHGSRSGGVGYIVSVGQSYEAYDDIRLKFGKDQILKDWNVDCVR